jgi:hypothetical protein
VPVIVGTLWDVKPPEDPERFVGTFYRRYLADSDAATALLEARQSASRSAAWEGCWQAYVAIGE